MHPIYAHLQWRDFLRKEQEARREADAGFTWKALSERLGIDPAQFARILRGAAPLPFRYVPGLAREIGLDRRGEAYLEELLRLERCRTEEERGRCRLRLAALRGVASREVGGPQAEFYARWHHAVIRALLGLSPQRGDGADLGTLCLPAVAPEDARHSVELLVELGLVEPDPKGVLRLTEAHLVAGAQIPAEVVRDFHRQAVALARESLASIAPSERDVSAITASLDEAGFGKVRELARELRQKVQSLAHRTVVPDRVFQLSLQAFPVGQCTLAEPT